MKNKLKILVQYLIHILNGDISKSSIQKISIYISVLSALYSLKKNKKKISRFIISDYKEQYDLIAKNFHCLAIEFNAINMSLSEEVRDKIFSCLLDVYSCADENEKNTISWIYQYLKHDLEKKAFSSIGAQQNKIKGNDILYATQFFTDEYMVKYLVDKIFEIKQDKVCDVLFVDPASGGGNFLTYTFDKLYNWYRENTNMSKAEVIDYIFSKNILGYDLDAHLAKIASLSLFVNACKYEDTNFKESIKLYGGIEDDTLGYLANVVESTTTVGRYSFLEAIEMARSVKMDIVYITNPPFMGKRDMDNILKTHLLKKFPLGKGDLCVSFMYKMMEQMKNNDLMAIVSQNGWMNLSSLKSFRKYLLEKFHIYECIDLGSNAFVDINGEKTNVVLCVIGKKNAQNDKNKSIFYNLKEKKHYEKIPALINKNADSFEVQTSNFLNNPNYEISYQLGVDFSSLKTLPTYGMFAKCMQGTSTGNNKEFVKYAWEITDNTDWVLVSKGGGYSKWRGLNYYKVKWGKDAELIRTNFGSALRNIEHIGSTDLVYSDTGTLGLNVRLLLPKQVFIASGPGIKVLDGLPVCHMAYLNSCIATFLLKISNPKFTVSAGYISSLPVVKSILFSSKIEMLAKKCVAAKLDYISSKLPNWEFTHEDYSHITNVESYIRNNILSDFTNDYIRYESELAIDIEICKAYKFSKKEIRQIHNMVGGLNMITCKNESVDISTIDKAIVSIINENCISIGRKINGYAVGSESIIEIVGYNLNINSNVLYDLLLSNISNLILLAEKYKLDLLHKVILKTIGIENIKQLEPINIKLDVLCEKIRDQYFNIYEQLGISTTIIKNIINIHHMKSFQGKPLLKVNDNETIISLF